MHLTQVHYMWCMMTSHFEKKESGSQVSRGVGRQHMRLSEIVCLWWCASIIPRLRQSTVQDFHQSGEIKTFSNQGKISGENGASASIRRRGS